VLCASVLSGFAGVYFERILKGSTTTLWVRNIQMGIPSIFLALLGVFSADFDSVTTSGFFAGYSTLVWVVILLQALGGLVVAVVVKYADNILKGFAASFSIITAIALSYALFHDFDPDIIFTAGAILVNVSMYVYSYVPQKTAAGDKPAGPLFFFSGGSAGGATKSSTANKASSSKEEV
jgi:UDP-sugar transporter A1/2/3